MNRKTLTVAVVVVAIAILAISWWYLQIKNNSPASVNNQPTAPAVATGAPQGGQTYTLEGLVKALQNAYIAKDSKVFLSLFYDINNVDEVTKSSLVKGFSDDFHYQIDSVRVVEPVANNIYQYTLHGISYHVSLPVVKEVKVNFKKNVAGITSTSYYVGMHNNGYYLVTAVPLGK